jgi:mannose-1-phosphate guanylyltransferase
VSNGHGDSFRALRFVEKPELARAIAYVESGRFLWNASMFIWKCATLLEVARALMPDLLEAIEQIVEVWDTPDREDTIIRIWEALPESTIDQGIMEKAERVAVVPANIGWSDVGDWHGLGELIEQDSVGNSVRGDIVQVETKRSVVWSETGRLVALIGLENVVVVDTEDALMVIDRERSQDVKKIVGELKRLSRHEFS